MSIYNIYFSETAFWEDFSIINESFKQNRRMKWVEILLKIWLKRQTIDAEDAVKAKAEY